MEFLLIRGIHDLTSELCTRVPMSVGTQSNQTVSVGAPSQSSTQNVTVGAAFQDQSSPSYYFTSITPYASTPYCPPYPGGSSTPSHSFQQPLGPLRQPYCYEPWTMLTYSCSTYSPYSESVNPYSVTFIEGSIKIRIGCKNQYEKSPQPPNDLCIKHQKWRKFTTAGSQTLQTKFCNAYYHCKPQCVWLRCGNFNPSCVNLSEDVRGMLTPVHREYLMAYFGVN